MESDIDRHKATLERVLELSLMQKRFLEENRLVELVKAQRERDGLFNSLNGLTPQDCRKDPIRGLVKKILESDRAMALNMEVIMQDCKKKLKKVGSGKKAVKAYGRQ